MHGDYSSCDNTIPTSLFIRNKFFPSHLFASFFLLLAKVTASYCIAIVSFFFVTLDMYVEYFWINTVLN